MTNSVGVQICVSQLPAFAGINGGGNPIHSVIPAQAGIQVLCN